MFVANACTVCWTAHYKWQLCVLVSDYYYYFIMFNGLAWPVSSVSACLQRIIITQTNTQSSDGFFERVIRFHFLLFSTSFGPQLAVFCVLPRIFIFFAKKHVESMPLPLELASALSPKKHSENFRTTRLNASLVENSSHRFERSSSGFFFGFLSAAQWRMKKKELKAQNHCKW